MVKKKFVTKIKKKKIVYSLKCRKYRLLTADRLFQFCRKLPKKGKKYLSVMLARAVPNIINVYREILRKIFAITAVDIRPTFNGARRAGSKDKARQSSPSTSVAIATLCFTLFN